MAMWAAVLIGGGYVLARGAIVALITVSRWIGVGVARAILALDAADAVTEV